MIQHLEPTQLTRHGLSSDQAHAFSKAFNDQAAALDPASCWRKTILELKKPDHPFELYRFLHQHIFAQWDANQGPAPAWSPTSEEISQTNIARLMAEQGKASYLELYSWSIEQPQAFWDCMTAKMNIRFRKHYDQALDLSSGAEHPRWLAGARYNIVESCFSGDQSAPAVVHGGADGPLQTMTISQLRKLTDRVANGLADRGLKCGDAIGIDMPMRVESVAIYLGIIKAGMVVISIADSMAPAEIATRLKIADAKAIFTQDVLLRAGKTLPLFKKVAEANAPPAIVLPACGSAPEAHLLRRGDVAWNDFLGSEAPFEALIGTAHTATNILFSSGTTGEPKAIPWNQTTPIKAAIDGYLHLNIQPRQVVAWPTNLGWMMGPWLIYASLLNRATIALFEDSPSGKPFCRFVQDAGINVLGLVPSLVKAWRAQDALRGLDWSRLQCFGSTGECSNAEDYLYLMVESGHHPVIEYCGGTEIGGGYITGTMVQPSAPATFSTPALGSAFTILDENNRKSDNGEVFLIPPAMGLSLELLNRNHHDVYYADTPTNPDGKVLRRHGDQIEALPGGYFRAHGRVDDTMNLGGIKISSVEIERTLDVLEGIARTAAIAVPPPGGGPSVLVIYAVAADAAADSDEKKVTLQRQMQQTIKNNLNPLFKIHAVVWTDQLPVTASNKVMRRKLRERYIAQHQQG